MSHTILGPAATHPVAPHIAATLRKAQLILSGIKPVNDEFKLTRLTGGVTAVTGVKASLSCATKGNGKLDTVVEAHTAGAAGNALQVVLVGDSGTGAGVTIAVAAGVVTIHFEVGVSTVTNVETAIAALAGADDVVDVKTAGTGATVLDAGAAFTASNLTGGVTAVAEVKASLDLSTLCRVDTILEAHTAGAAGNGIRVCLVGDNATGEGVTIARDGNDFIIHYEDGVSNVSALETDVTALAGANDLIDVKTAGTADTVLYVSGIPTNHDPTSAEALAAFDADLDALVMAVQKFGAQNLPIFFLDLLDNIPSDIRTIGLGESNEFWTRAQLRSWFATNCAKIAAIS